MTHTDYWEECISNAAEEIGLKLDPAEINCLAKAVEAGHDNYGQCFYSPPASDMYNHQKREEG